MEDFKVGKETFVCNRCIVDVDVDSISNSNKMECSSLETNEEEKEDQGDTNSVIMKNNPEMNYKSSSNSIESEVIDLVKGDSPNKKKDDVVPAISDDDEKSNDSAMKASTFNN